MLPVERSNGQALRDQARAAEPEPAALDRPLAKRAARELGQIGRRRPADVPAPRALAGREMAVDAVDAERRSPQARHSRELGAIACSDRHSHAIWRPSIEGRLLPAVGREAAAAARRTTCTSVLPARLVVSDQLAARRPRPRSARGTASGAWTTEPVGRPCTLRPDRHPGEALADELGRGPVRRDAVHPHVPLVRQRREASRVSRTIAAFAVAYSGYECGWVPRPAIDDTLTIDSADRACSSARARAGFPASSRAARRRALATTPRPSRRGSRAPLPSNALFTRMSSPPNSASAAAIISFTSSLRDERLP